MIDSPYTYHCVSTPSKANHVKLQKQKNIVKASKAVVKTLNTLIVIKSNEKLSSQTLTELKQKVLYYLAMVSKANKYINVIRTDDDVLPQLGKNIKQIRFNISKKSKTLFGEDVSMRITSVKKMERDIRSSSSCSITPQYHKSKSNAYTPYNSTLDCQINRGRGSLNNRVSWKFRGYLISGEVLINQGDGKSENYVFVANVHKQAKLK